MNRNIVTPTLIQIVYSTAVIILSLFLPSFAKPAIGEFFDYWTLLFAKPATLFAEPAIGEFFDYYWTLLYTLYVPIILVFPQAMLVAKYLLYFSLKEFYLSIQAFYTLNVLRRYYSPKDYFKRGRYEKPVVQYEYVKKILYSQIFLFVLLVGIYYIPDLLTDNYIKDISKKDEALKNSLTNFKNHIKEFRDKIGNMAYVSFFTIYSVIVPISIISAKKEFRFYFAQACIRIISENDLSEKKDQVEKIYYLILGLNSYNIYLRRSINLKIGDTKRLYSKIISHSPIEKNGSISFLSSAFNDDNDKLKPARYLSTYLEDREEGFLVKESLSGKIETWGKFAATIIPVIIAIIRIVYPSP